MATTYIVDKDGNSIDASTATVPSARHFRGAWSLSGKVISEDLTKAKEIFKDKLKPKFSVEKWARKVRSLF